MVCCQLKSSEDQQLQVAIDTGAGVIRRGFYWDKTEKVKGEYDWSEYDELFRKCQKNGLRVMLTCAFNNKLYDTENKRAIVTESGREGYANWLAAAAKHFKDYDVVWELWNEPNLMSFWRKTDSNKSNTPDIAKEYSDLVKTTVPKMKGADPGCVVVICSLSCIWKESIEWLDAVIEEGAFGVDVAGISVHPYGDKPEKLVLVPENSYEELIKRFKKMGKPELQIVNSEVGYSAQCMNRTRGTPMGKQAFEESAWMWVRQKMIDLMYGVRIANWYDMQDHPHPKKKLVLFGIVDKDFNPRPAYHAMKQFCTALKGYNFIKRIDLGEPTDFCCLMQDDTGKQKLVVWCCTKEGQKVETPHEVIIPLPAPSSGQITVSDIFGEAKNLPAKDKIKITISGAPQYISL